MLRHRREPTGQLRLSESATFLRSAAFEELPSSWKLKHRKDRQSPAVNDGEWNTACVCGCLIRYIMEEPTDETSFEEGEDEWEQPIMEGDRYGSKIIVPRFPAT